MKFMVRIKDKWKTTTWEPIGIFGNIYIWQPYNKIELGLRIINIVKISTLKNKKLGAINMNIITTKKKKVSV